jgi:hypothetical protein
VNTPPAALVNNENVQVGGGRTLTRAQYDEAKRYFEYFQDARLFAIMYYSIMYNSNSGMCAVLARNKVAPDFKFMFDAKTTTLLNDNIENCLANVRSQSGGRGW